MHTPSLSKPIAGLQWNWRGIVTIKWSAVFFLGSNFQLWSHFWCDISWRQVINLKYFRILLNANCASFGFETNIVVFNWNLWNVSGYSGSSFRPLQPMAYETHSQKQWSVQQNLPCRAINQVIKNKKTLST